MLSILTQRDVLYQNYQSQSRYPYLSLQVLNVVLDDRFIYNIIVYRHTLRICNSYCSSSATVVTWTRRIATLYERCLSGSDS